MATLKELESEIERLDKALQDTRINAKNLAEQMRSGEWGTQQIKQMAEQLRSMSASISRMKTERLKLVDDKALRDFNLLTRQIETLQQRITTGKGTLNLFATDDPQYQKLMGMIRNAEIALKSLESRRFTQFGPQGYRKEEGAGAFGGAGGRLEGVSARQGTLYSGYEERLRAVSARQGTFFSGYEARLQEVTKELEQVERAAHSVVNRIGGGAYGPEGAPATPPRTRGVPFIGEEFRKQWGALPEELKTDAAKAALTLKRLHASLTELNGIEQIPGGFRLTGKKDFGEAGIRDIQSFVDGLGNTGRSLKELHRKQVLNSKEYIRLFEEASKLGYSKEDFRRIKASGTGAYKQAEFQKSVGGVEYLQNFRVDRTGDVSLAATQRKFQSFAQTVGRDIAELTKWSIAIAAIYGPINAMGTAISALIENETKLADVTVALNKEVADTGAIFDVAYSAAQRSGEGVGGVIDAFGQAYRAAGRIENQFERFTAASKLLDASLVLSKVSTLDQAQAIDTLTAALYQAAGTNDTASTAFDRATQVLDQWVRVSKVANVDVATLATGVAVLGDSAEVAGLSLEQLNALIATISEVSISSGKEAANIAKALVGNYIQPQAIEALNKLGVAVKDVTGKNRDFLSVMRELSDLRRAGLLTDQQLQQAALTLGGGGVRRAKDVAALIENFPRLGQIVELQANSTGESSTALAKKLDTVQTSSTQLANSFQSLAQSLGDEGGLLDVFSGILDISTKLVEAMDKIASSVGRVSPLLIGLGVGALGLRLTGTNARSVIGNNIAPFLAGLAPGGEGARANIRTRESITNFLTGQSTAGRIGLSAAAIAIPAAQNLAGGRYEQVGADIVGGIAGAFVGGPAGAVVGSAIAEAFVNATFAYEAQFQNFFAGAVSKGLDGASKDTAAQNSVDNLMSEAFKALGYGNVDLGKFLAKQAQYTTLPGGLREKAYETPEAAALAQLKRTNPDLYKRILSVGTSQGLQQANAPLGGLAARQQAISTPETQAYLTQIQREKAKELQTQLISGKIKPSEYAREMEQLSAYTVKATRYMAALEDQVGKLGPGFNNNKEAYQSFLEIVASGNDELISQINSQIEAVDYLQQVIKNWQPGTEIENKLTGEKFVPKNISEITNLLNLTQGALGQTFAYGAQQSRLQNLRVPEVFGSNLQGFSKQDLALLLKETQKYQEIRYQELPPETYQALTESFDKVSFLIEDGGKLLHETLGKIDQKILSEVYQKLVQEGRIRAQEDKGIGFSTIGATAAQVRAAEAQAPSFIAKNLTPLGYKSEEADAIYSTTDEQILKAHGDQKIIQYLLQQILDTEKKQLEGIYNLPEGATFWVPLTAAWLAQRPYGAGEGGTGGQSYAQQNAALAGMGGLPSPYNRAGATTTPPRNPLAGQGGIVSPVDYSKLAKPSEPTTRPGRFEPGDRWWEEKLPTTKQPGAAEGLNALITQLINQISGLFRPGGPLGGFTGVGQGLGTGAKPGPLQAPQAPSVNTKLDIRFASTTQLMVDGRILASIVKPYLAADLLRTNESGGTITRSYVI